MSSSKVDPRKEEAIVPFHLPRKNEQEEEYNSTLATFIGEYWDDFFFYIKIIFKQTYILYNNIAMAGIMTRVRETRFGNGKQ